MMTTRLPLSAGSMMMLVLLRSCWSSCISFLFMLGWIFLILSFLSKVSMSLWIILLIVWDNCPGAGVQLDLAVNGRLSVDFLF